MASSLRGTIKYLRGIGKFTPKQTSRLLKALDVVDYIKNEEYLYQWEEDDDYTMGYNSCLEDMKREAGCKDES